MRRHDPIVNYLCDHLKENPEVRLAKEQTFRVEPGEERLKPDLVVAFGGVSYIVDVTVRLEVDGSLADAHAEKILKYEVLALQVNCMFATNTAKVLPIVVGARGALPKQTKENLAVLGLGTRGILRTLSVETLKASLNMLSCFMDYGE